MSARAPAVSADVAAARTAYLADMSGYLWPGTDAGLERTSHRAATKLLQEYVVLPDRRGPRLLLPAHAPAAAAAAVRGASEPRSSVAQLARAGVSQVARSGWADRLLPLRFRVRVTGEAGSRSGDNPAYTIEDHLRDACGDVVLSLSLAGQARANRKPVLQVLRRDGTPVGFAKVGTNELTRRLVRAEHDALKRLKAVPERLPTVAVADVLDMGDLAGACVLVQSALPVRRRRLALDPGRVAAAARDVAHALGARLSPLSSSTYLRELCVRVEALPPGAEADALRLACRDLAELAPERQVLFGCSHGDWTPWNMASANGRLCVWDWERFCDDAPVGFDLLHYALQENMAERGMDPQVAAAAQLQSAAGLLAPLGVAGGSAEIVVLLYLVDIAARYVADREVRDGAQLADVGSWLLPLLAERTQALAPLPGEP